MTRDITANEDPNVIRLFLVRHGRTDWNAKKIMQGHIDIDMNEVGKDQAAKVGKYFKDIQLDHLVTSDLVRCTNTAQAILDHHPELLLTVTENLRERNMGPVQGMLVADAIAQYGTDFRNFGEKEEMLLSRVAEEWDLAIKTAVTEGYKNTLLCTHGGVLTAFSNYLFAVRGYDLAEGMTKADLRVPYNTSVTVVDIDKSTGSGKIQKFGVTEHLGGDFRVSNQLLR